ncbi:hypothetical protein HAX54_033673 [Datura stramonium]|uniref:Uncharacterized protein n=1 Tax=Datura stramonium TaxID=4076 RepID=A0ABS8VFC6_DATST|nr:hypothetical protein [Datura stramonium]
MRQINNKHQQLPSCISVATINNTGYLQKFGLQWDCYLTLATIASKRKDQQKKGTSAISTHKRGFDVGDLELLIFPHNLHRKTPSPESYLSTQKRIHKLMVRLRTEGIKLKE